MNIYISGQIAELKEKLNAYVALFNYRLNNLCVKAEITALMPVTVVTTEEKNLEEVAKIAIPNEYQFEIYPEINEFRQQIIDGIFDVHPEFKLEIKQDELNSDKEAKHLVYTMPEVDKNRRDLLTDRSKLFHKECMARIDATCATYTGTFTGLDDYLSPEDLDELSEVFSHTREEYENKADELLMNKLDEIDEAYDRYEEQSVAAAQQNFDVTAGIRLGAEEE